MRSDLYDLIQALQYGTKLHIGVLFFNDYGNEKCRLPFHHTIHSREVCDALKEKGRQSFRRCFSCRNLAIQKALTEKKPFGGICINGVYEYTHPVVIRGEVVCIIYIGNILDPEKGQAKLEKQLNTQSELVKTLENNYSYDQCAMTAGVIESFILFLLDTYGYRNKRTNPLIENIKNYLDANLEYDISLPRITAIFHYNQQYLGRLFKNETGISIKAYILQQRIQRARLLLESSGDSVIEIATRVGFNNVTYFNRQFRRIYGMTPSQCRGGEK